MEEPPTLPIKQITREVEPAIPVPADRPQPRFGSLQANMLEWSAASSATASVASIFGKAFLEALAKRAAESATGLPGKFRQRMVRRRAVVPGTLRRRLIRSRADGTEAVVLTVEDTDSAAILVTADLPDEARLALLDLDPTAPALLGKVLRWNAELRQWAAAESPVS